MATGGSALTGGHDEIFEWNCSHCEAAEKFVEAVMFCQDCGEFYCEPCWIGHERFPALKNHTALGKSQQESWGTRKKNERQPDECELHDGQTLSMYCENHDVICCAVCASLEHRTCEGMLYIPQAAKGIADSRQLRDTVTEMKETCSFMKKIKTRKVNCRAEIEDYKCSVLNSIEEQRRKVNKAFDELKRKAESEMAEFYETKLEKLKKETDICEITEISLKPTRELLMTKEGLNEKQILMNLKSGQRKLRKLKKDIPGDITEMPNKQKLEISLNPELLEAVDNLIESLDANNCTKIANYEYTVKEKHDTNISTDEDEGPCSILDLCVLPNGNILLSDNANKKLKELDSSFTVINQCNLKGSCYGVCCVDNDKVVVALENNSLAFVSTREMLEVTETVELSHSCYGVAHHGDRLYVSNGAKNVYVYCSACMPLDSLSMYTTYFQCFLEARLITISADGTKLHVNDDSKGLVTIDNNGKLLSTFTHPDLQDARGVCLDNRGSVFVSGVVSDNVLQLDSLGGTVVSTVATCEEGLNSPISMIFNKSSLIITNGSAGNRNTLTVLDLKVQ